MAMGGALRSSAVTSVNLDGMVGPRLPHSYELAMASSEYLASYQHMSCIMYPLAYRLYSSHFMQHDADESFKFLLARARFSGGDFCMKRIQF